MMRWLPALLSLSLTGCFNSLVLTPANVHRPVEENVVVEPDGWFCSNKIAIIDVEGTLVNAKSAGLLSEGDNPVSLFRERLNKAAEDDNVRGVVLRINSPGGAVTASDIMYRDVLTFRQQTGKPVVACMMDVAASGGYYVAMGCDHVIAHPTTVTGSIGVIMSLYNASTLMQTLGVRSNPIKSGRNKDLGNPAREMTDEERAILQGMVDNFYSKFVEVVAEGRNMSEDEVRKLADGRVYSGTDAQKLGLVDRVGYLEDAFQATMDLAGIQDAKVVAFDKSLGNRGSIYAGTPSLPSNINVNLQIPGLSDSSGASFMYLWKPGVLP